MSVRVVARIRPLLEKELDKDTIVRAECSQEGKSMNIVRIPNPKNESEEFSFAFNGVYDTETTQEELFTNEVSPTLKSLFQGLDVTIFAYGVTGTGKTHTMRGGLRLSERGVIPRLLSAIYRRGRKVTKDSGGETTVNVTLSYYEIYNDKVFDLFEPPEKRTAAGLPLREKDGKTIVVGLSERACDDLKDFERLYIEANNNRSTAGTKLNAQSSRSHAILMVKLTQTTGDECRICTASAIDLAGSEDNRRTENGKERLVESASINKSLFVLSQCIDAIGRGDRRIPYRESKMTRILSLGQNNGITIMILNLSPLRSYHLDTLSSLNVSSRAKRIEVREIENEIVFKQPPRTTSAIIGSTIQRQPLRPLANAHNTSINNPAASKKGGDKPTKAFSVYSDRSRSSGNKRPSDTIISTRPTKIMRTSAITKPPAPELSASKIEEMVERKVSEILAARALNQAPVTAPDNTISEAVQRRLDALEKKIESGEKEDARSEGLRFLLMAKQHKERGEDSSALKMYELAVPFFPGQQKLQKKIDALRAKIAAKRQLFGKSQPEVSDAATANTQGTLPTPPMSSEAQRPTTTEAKTKPKRRQANAESDDEYDDSEARQHQPHEGHHNRYDDEDDEDSFAYKPSKSRKPKPKQLPPSSKPSIPLLSSLLVAAERRSQTEEEEEEKELLTIATAQLLTIINSRDVALIKGLSGVGAKRARDLVEYLELMRADDEGEGEAAGAGATRIESLRQLRQVPGLGDRTVERMLEGVVGVGVGVGVGV